jgi:hypothetical protein
MSLGDVRLFVAALVLQARSLRPSGNRREPPFSPVFLRSVTDLSVKKAVAPCPRARAAPARPFTVSSVNSDSVEAMSSMNVVGPPMVPPLLRF